MTIHARAARPPDWPKDRLRRVSPIPSRSGEGRLTERTPAVRSSLREHVWMPHLGHSPQPTQMSQEGGYLPLAPGVSTDRYPIPQRTFEYVATVQSVTDETCQ